MFQSDSPLKIIFPSDRCIFFSQIFQTLPLVINVKNGVDSLVIIVCNNIHSHRQVKQIFQQKTEITGICCKIGPCLRENQIYGTIFAIFEQMHHFRAFINFLIPCDVNINTNQLFIAISFKLFSIVGTVIGYCCILRALPQFCKFHIAANFIPVVHSQHLLPAEHSNTISAFSGSSGFPFLFLPSVPLVC